MSNVNASGRAVLLAAINRGIAASGYQFAEDNLVFGAVEASENPARESQIEITPGSNTTVTGQGVDPIVISESQTIYFTRLDLTEIFTAASIAEVQIHEGPTTVAEVMAAVNDRYNLGFTAEDIVVDGAVEPGSTSVNLVAAAGSYGFKGQVSVSLVAVATPLANVVADPVLGDLEVTPVQLPLYLVAASTSTAEINTKGQTASGYMINGSGNPVGEMTVTSNGELELALGARVWKSGNLPPAQDGHYAISIADNGDWNWPFSITLLEESRPVTDLYDITLFAESVETGVSIPFYLSRDAEGVYHFANEDLGLDIVDSAQSESGDVVQNIQRMTFYKAQLGEPSTNTGGAPIGDFVVRLTADRREGQVETLVCEITVSVSVPGSEPV